jgi:hypothetical protein
MLRPQECVKNRVDAGHDAEGKRQWKEAAPDYNTANIT